jgi:uncharacterized protein (DUF433 family)
MYWSKFDKQFSNRAASAAKFLLLSSLSLVLLPCCERVYDDRRESGFMPALDWSQCPAVESIPGKVSGAWVLRGTRMPVSIIFENLEAGANIDDIMEWFEGLDRDQIKAVIEFAARSLDQTPSTTASR